MKQIIAITESLDKKGINGMLVSTIRNIRYLTGFTGSSACLLITKKERIFFTDSRYEEQSKQEISGFDILIEQERPKEILEKAKRLGIKTLGFESSVSYLFYRSLLKKGVRIKAVSSLVEDIRKIKDNLELKSIGMAAERAEKAFLSTKPYIKPGVSEKHLSARLEANLKKEGSFRVPFDIIVASGKNSAMPHARPTDNRVKAGDLIVFDWGGEADGYYSDMTRTFLLKGRGIQRKIEIYQTVLRSNERAISSVKEGGNTRMVDKTARDVIKKAGYGRYFGHGTGHGVGIDVHESPRISRFSNEKIKAGMVFTIEPGIYIPDVGGVRIEDMVVVGEEGCRVLTSLPKKLELL